MSEVAKIERVKPPAEAPRPDSMVSMLERVLMDPSVPVERLERLLELQDRERTRQAKVLWAERMSSAQAEVQAVVKNRDNNQTKSRYATYDALDGMVRPIYTKHGFSVTFNTESSVDRPDVIRIVAFVENSGFERRYEVEMPCDGKGAKGGDVMTKTHAVKSAVTYGKATLLPMIFNLAVTDKADDDGNGATSKDEFTVSDDQVAQLRKALEFVGGDEERFCRALKVGNLSCILESKFTNALDLINQKGRRQ